MMDVIYDSVKSYLERHFDSDQLEQRNCVDVGTILHTRESSQWTNATVIGLDPDARFRQVMILTDIGNVIYLSFQEMYGIYNTGKTRVLRDHSQTWLPEYNDANIRGHLKYTYKELLAKANVAAMDLLEKQGYEIDHNEKIYESEHPAEKNAFNTVCWVIQALHPNIDMEDVISYAYDSE